MSDVDNELFAGFAEDDDVVEESSTQSTGYGTLIKIITPESLTEEDNLIIRAGYITDGRIDELTKMRQFMIDAELAQYTSSAAVGAYSESLIADMTRTITNSYKIIENQRPLAEELVSAIKFNERFKVYVED